MRASDTAMGWKQTLVLGAFALALVGPESAHARNSGVDSGSMLYGPVTCSGIGLCHGATGSASNDIVVTITGPEALGVNETASYTIDVFETFPGGLATQVGAGVNVVAILDEVLTGLADGILDEQAPNLQITTGLPFFFEGGQLTHVAAMPLLGSPVTEANSIGVFSYDFNVIAPSLPGMLELRGAMNAFDGDGFPLGDKWNHTSLFITVPEPDEYVLGVVALVSVAALRRRRAC